MDSERLEKRVDIGGDSRSGVGAHRPLFRIEKSIGRLAVRSIERGESVRRRDGAN